LTPKNEKTIPTKLFSSGLEKVNGKFKEFVNETVISFNQEVIMASSGP
jgi:hypothetical protein